MELAWDIALSVLSGLIASAVFLLVLFNLRPRLEISPWIAREQDKDGKFFSFKAINRSSRPCHNVRVEATLAQPRLVEKGHVYWTRPLPINKADVFEMQRLDRNDRDANYAWRFVTEVDLDDVWTSDDSLVRFRVIATDSLTNFSRSFTREFRLPRNSIKDGSHHFGEDMEVS